MAYTNIPYWCYNIPKDQWPAECPEFLLNLSERDQKLVGRLDKDYQRLTWPEVKKVIGRWMHHAAETWLTLEEDNKLDRFDRVPSDLRRYIEYNAKLKEEYGSVMDFVVKERLKWTDLLPRDAVRFSDSAISKFAPAISLGP